jgi:hypothetical protein
VIFQSLLYVCDAGPAILGDNFDTSATRCFHSSEADCSPLGVFEDVAGKFGDGRHQFRACDLVESDALCESTDVGNGLYQIGFVGNVQSSLLTAT